MNNEQITGLDPTWAVIELFGHSQIAGIVSTITLGGACLLRVDVPEVVKVTRREAWELAIHGYKTIELSEIRVPAFTRILGIGAVYAINPCSEEVAKQMAKTIDPTPVALLSMTKTPLALPPPPALEVNVCPGAELDYFKKHFCPSCGSDKLGTRDHYCLNCYPRERLHESNRKDADPPAGDLNPLDPLPGETIGFTKPENEN